MHKGKRYERDTWTHARCPPKVIKEFQTYKRGKERKKLIKQCKKLTVTFTFAYV